MITGIIISWIIQFLAVLIIQICCLVDSKDYWGKYKSKIEPVFNWWQLIGGLAIPFSVPVYIVYWTIRETIKEGKTNE